METCNHNHQGEEEEEDQPTTNISSEEARNQENEDLLGVGRSHECVYCKRGYNTAQALGGHMNIHRKDRAKTNKPSDEDQNLKNAKIADTPGHSSIDHNHPSQSNEHHRQLGMISCGQYLPGSKSLSTPSCCNNYQPPIIDSKRTSLSLESPSKIVKILERRSDKQATNSRDELDLELRLGYDS